MICKTLRTIDDSPACGISTAEHAKLVSQPQQERDQQEADCSITCAYAQGLLNPA